MRRPTVYLEADRQTTLELEANERRLGLSGVGEWRRRQP
jgi:hypothetical protein